MKRRWRELGDSALCVSVVCEMEILQGLELNQSARLWDAYGSILADRLPILPVDLVVAKAYSVLAARTSRAGRPRPSFDLLIAATALAQGLVLATCNYRDFEGIEGLKVEDWSA